MLRGKEVMATIAVKDLARAERFYRDVLGLEPVQDSEPTTRGFRCGKSTVLVYESTYAGTNRATAATWIVGDEVDAIARDLKAKGVEFERYDMPGTTREGDVHVSGKVRVAWARDPDGNILAIANG